MDDFEKLLNKALRYLSFRPRSEKEIRDYLLKKKADEQTLEKIVKNLKEHKFIDDESFVKWWIEQRTVIKPRAEKFIRFELRRKGINQDLIDKNFEGDLVSDYEKAKNLADKRLVRYSKLTDRNKIYEKLGRFLASKGFNYDTIKEVIDQILPR